VARAIDILETNLKVEVTGEILEKDQTVGTEMVGITRRSGEFYEILCMLTSGDAKTLVRNVTSCDGFTTWQVLKKTYARTTLAKSLRRYREAVNPKQVKNVVEIVGAVAKWEGEVKEVEKAEGLVMPPMIRMAALTEICTDEIRDMIFQNVDECGADKEQTYRLMRDKIISWVSNRVAAKNEAVPMDVGNIEDYEDHYIDAIGGKGGMKCYECGGLGHPARICPNRIEKEKGKGKGKGKTNDGKGKGKGKGAGGKGYQGTCFKCGKVGHKANECWGQARTAYGVDIEDDEEEGGLEQGEREVGGVWMVGNVETKYEHQERDGEEWQEMRRKKKLDWKDMQPMRVKVPQNMLEENRFWTGEDDADNCKLWLANEIFIGSVDGVNKDVCAMNFHLTRSKRILASVAKITEAGNDVKFGKGPGNSYIQSVKTGRKIPLKLESNVYVMNVMVWDGEVKKKCKVVVGSGAAENVMPREWFQNIETAPRKKGVRFVAANGEELGNYGQKQVQFETMEDEVPVFSRRAM
jgi:hypothetical protein